MNDIASLIEVAYCLPEKFNSLECGACSLEEIETKKWADSQTAWYLEPNVRIYDSIKRLGYNVLNLALSDHDKSEIFNISMYDGFGYLESSGTNDSLKNNEQIKTSYNVNCITYKNLQETLNLTFDIMILDIEGQEDKVLKNLSSLDANELPKIFCIECGYDWEKRKALVKNLGYDLDFYYYNNAYFSMNDPYNKNINTINYYNRQWPQWTYNGIEIYKNENTNL